MLGVGGLQTLCGVFGVNEAVGTVVTCMVMSVDCAVVGLAHTLLEVIKQLTLSPFARLLLLYVAELVPTAVLFKIHWYVGDDPPLTGVAVKVTLVPLHIFVDVADIVIDGVVVALIVSVTAGEVEEQVVDPFSVMITAYEPV